MYLVANRPLIFVACDVVGCASEFIDCSAALRCQISGKGEYGADCDDGVGVEDLWLMGVFFLARCKMMG
jgi:hypothetical protein